MATTALLINPNHRTTGLHLPDKADDQARVLREKIGSTLNQGIFHRRAVLHIAENGRSEGLPAKLVVWALASAWRGIPLCPIAGPVVITGPDGPDGYLDIDEDLRAQAEDVALEVVSAPTCQDAR
ncbi:hypothetical protein ABWI13_28670 [Streptomyces koyangensis]|uniref:hypothetical protein n=1 Tax=Streptomyces koyangensis TaxID=188770 RepID=UPI00337F40A4